MPVRDAAATVDEALESLLAQRSADFEIVAVDDGSKDASLDRLRVFERRDPRVRVLVARENGAAGLVAALNLGVRAARGDLVARMDADDVAHPDRLAEQTAYLCAHPDVAVVGTRVEAFPREAVGAGLARYVEWQNSLVTPGDHAREIFIEAPLCHPSVVMRRSALFALEGYRDVRWPEDYDLWLRFDGAGARMAKIPRVLLLWRHQEGRATFTDARYHRARFFAAKAETLAARLRRLGRPVWVWGAGPVGRRTARALEAYGVFAAAFVDIDPRKIGRTARRAPILPVDAIQRGAATVLAAVGSLGARARIRELLHARGFVEGEDFLCAA
jgi:glycosyltransferase involved in cell wall biosynthesis